MSKDWNVFLLALIIMVFWLWLEKVPPDWWRVSPGKPVPEIPVSDFTDRACLPPGRLKKTGAVLVGMGRAHLGKHPCRIYCPVYKVEPDV